MFEAAKQLFVMCGSVNWQRLIGHWYRWSHHMHDIRPKGMSTHHNITLGHDGRLTNG